MGEASLRRFRGGEKKCLGVALQRGGGGEKGWFVKGHARGTKKKGPARGETPMKKKNLGRGEEALSFRKKVFEKPLKGEKEEREGTGGD